MEVSGEKQYRILNRDVVKYIAVFTMLLNHVAVIFLESGSIVYELLVSIGYFTAISMIYFLVEGYHYTHSKKAYFGRMFVFGSISQIPFSLAFTQEGLLEFERFNMLFTLCLCFGVIWVWENIANPAVKDSLIFLLVLAGTMFDWGVMAPVFTLLFLWAGGSRKKLKLAFAGAVLIFTAYNIWEGSYLFPVERNLFYAALGAAGMGMSGLCIVYLYNGKRMEKGKKFSKWFFYVFYPAHLLVLGLIRILAA